MKIITTLAGTLAVLATAQAQWKPPAAMTVIGSASGQFFVSARNSYSSPHSIDLGMTPNMITLQPALMAVSCERIKQELLHELDMRDQWQGKIFVVLRPAFTTNDAIKLGPQKLGGNWDCGVEMPDVVDRNRFVGTIVRACLLEMANRNAGNRSSEIPEWLAQGFTRQLMGSSAVKLILPTPRGRENGLSISRTTVDFTDAPYAAGPSTRALNPLAQASLVLHQNEPLTFDQLSWPTDEQMEGGPGAELYGCSAQLFVSKLLHLKNGPAGVSAMLAEMPNYLNWQLAFMDAFKENFHTQLEVEKWWALELEDFSGRDLLHLLTPEESWRQLNAVFQFPINVQIGDAPPMRTDISFQTIIRGWSRAQQLDLIKKKVWELDLLRMRIAPDFIPLVDGYRETLREYYKKRSATTWLLPSLFAPLPDKAIDEAVARLNTLDVRRANMSPQPAPVASAGGTQGLPATVR
jgi:hypothetical protein